MSLTSLESFGKHLKCQMNLILTYHLQTDFLDFLQMFIRFNLCEALLSLRWTAIQVV